MKNVCLHDLDLDSKHSDGRKRKKLGRWPDGYDVIAKWARTHSQNQIEMMENKTRRMLGDEKNNNEQWIECAREAGITGILPVKFVHTRIVVQQSWAYTHIMCHVEMLLLCIIYMELLSQPASQPASISISVHMLCVYATQQRCWMCTVYIYHSSFVYPVHTQHNFSFFFFWMILLVR